MLVAERLQGETMRWEDRIGQRLKLRDLHILLAVAQCRSMSRAADQLAISHPVVSKTISDLEKTLGLRLFDRTPQGTEPTAYGNALLRCGTVVLTNCGRARRRSLFWPIRPSANCASAARTPTSRV